MELECCSHCCTAGFCNTKIYDVRGHHASWQRRLGTEARGAGSHWIHSKEAGSRPGVDEGSKDSRLPPGIHILHEGSTSLRFQSLSKTAPPAGNLLIKHLTLGRRDGKVVKTVILQKGQVWVLASTSDVSITSVRPAQRNPFPLACTGTHADKHTCTHS